MSDKIAVEDPKIIVNQQADNLARRAAAHGVFIKPGDAFLVVVEKLIERMDAYRDEPSYKGKLVIE